MARFTAIYYPFISIGVVLTLPIAGRAKATVIIFTLLLLGIFIGFTRQAYYKETGVAQFTASGGWILAGNALYGYAQDTLDSASALPHRFRGLHSLVNSHMDSIRRIAPSLRPDRNVALYYVWDFNSPLRVYMSKYWQKDTATPFVKRWGTMGPLYTAYGRWLILHHTGAFIRYYLWPNFLKYYTPPLGFMEYYNYGNAEVASPVVRWFGWKNNKVANYFNDQKIDITAIFPVLSALINFFFVVGFSLFIGMGGFRHSSRYIKRVLKFSFLIWLLNMAFSVFATPIELRYQIFPIVVTSSFTVFLLVWIFGESSVPGTSNDIYEIQD